MNYCLIEDAWKNSNYISDQYSKKNTIENFDANLNVSDNQFTPNQYISTNEYGPTHDIGNQYISHNRYTNQFTDNQYTDNQYTDNQYATEHFTSNNQFTPNNQYTQSIPFTPNYSVQNHKDCKFTCADFWQHLETCHVCKKKIRERHSSRLIERIQNNILDNKDTILLILIILFLLVFFNLLISIFKK